MTQKVDISNFMGVIQATQQTEEGLVFPGEHMLSGNPVVSPGATMADIMGDRGMAEQWYNAIKVTYEQEKEQRDNPRSEEDTPDLVIRGEDADAGEPAGGGSPATVHPAQAQEELPEATTQPENLRGMLTGHVDYWRYQVDRLAPELSYAENALKEAEAALAALGDPDGV